MASPRAGTDTSFPETKDRIVLPLMRKGKEAKRGEPAGSAAAVRLRTLCSLPPVLAAPVRRRTALRARSRASQVLRRSRTGQPCLRAGAI